MMAAAAAMLFAACGKDEEDSSNTSGNGSGTTTVAGTTWVGSQGNPQTDDNYAVYTLNLGSDNRCTMSIDFYAASEGGHYATTDFTGTYTLSGNSGTMTLSDGLPDKGTYNDTFTLNGNSMTLTHGRVTVSLDKQASPTPTPADPDNMARLGNGNAIALQSTLEFDDFGKANFAGMYHQGGIAAHFGAGIAWESLGRTLDLASPQATEEYWFRYEEWHDTNMVAFTQNNNFGNVNGDLNNGESTSQPIFTSGTLTTAHVAGGYTRALDGTLKDGTTVSIRLKVTHTDEVVPLTPNSIIYDGVKYECRSGATRTASGMVQWSLSDGDATVTGHIYPGSDNLHAYLHESPIGDGYHFDFSVSLPGLQLDYDWNNDQLDCTLDGQTVPNPFPEGNAEFNVYTDEAAVWVVGTLTNGKVLKFRMATVLQ